MKIKTKLIIGFAVLVSCTWMIIFHANTMAGQVEEKFTTLEEQIIPGVLLMSDIESTAITTNRNITAYAIYGMEEAKQAALLAMDNLDNMGQEQLGYVANTAPENLAAAEDMVAKIGIYNLAALGIIDLAEQGANSDELIVMNGATLKPAITDLITQAQERKTVHLEALTTGEANLRETNDSIFRMNLTAGSVITFLGIMVAVFITRQVTNPLNALRKGTEIIGTGKLDHKVGTKAQDEIGQLSRAFDDMTERLSASLVSIDNLNEEISGREQMEQALRESEKKLKHIFEAAGDGITVTDLSGNIIEANDNLARMVGLKHAKDLIGKNTIEFIPPHEIERAMAHLQGIPSQHSVVVAELDLRKANGTEFPVEINASVMKNASGEVTGQVAIIRDTTKRKRMEKDLGNRLKELNCLYGIAKTAQKSRITLDRIYEEIVCLLPKSWQYPEITCARITFGSKEYTTENCRETEWKQSADIMVHGEKAGKIELIYLEKKPEFDEGPFSKEEQQLLNTVAERLGKITQRKQTEQALKDSEEKYRSLINNVKVGILRSTIGPPGRILELNPAMEKITGYSREELLKMDISKLYSHSEQRSVLSDELKAAKTPLIRELNWKRKDGREVVILNKLVPVSDKNGKILYVDAITEDITEQKRAESALLTSEEKYRTLVENATDLIYMTDTNERILSLNRTAAVSLGINPEKVIGKSIFEVLPRNIAEQFSKDSKLAFKMERTITSETKIKIGGEERWSSNSLSPIKNGKNEVISVMGVSRDITERHQMIKELQDKNEQLDVQNEELQVQSEELMAQQHELASKTEEVTRANQLKSEFLANMSHELRTPLNVIIGFSQLMADRVPGEINQKQRQCLEDILGSSQNLLTLINDILDLSKIESGKLELKPESFALSQIIQSVSRSMMPILATKKQSLDIEIAEGLPPVYANKNKIEQVFLNLIDNSSKFTPEGGKLKIKAESNKYWCRVNVIDNGIGINKEEQRRIFEPFCQLENSPPTKKPGTGLGLALAKQIVERYGGKLWVKSKQGKGSQFILTIPLAESPHPEEINWK